MIRLQPISAQSGQNQPNNNDQILQAHAKLLIQNITNISQSNVL